VKLEVSSVDDIEQRPFVFGEVPGGGFVVDSYEDFGVVYSWFNISEHLSSVPICFFSFIEKLGENQIPIGKF
jgi:hypothetical protein